MRALSARWHTGDRGAAMRVEISTSSDKDQFFANSWWAYSPEFVTSTLQSQLEAAQAIWPELKQYKISKKRDRKKGEVKS